MAKNSTKDIEAQQIGGSRIVSSSHLAATSKMPELSEFEFGLILASNAFDRWMVRCMAATGLPGLTALEVLVLHSVNHRQRAKRLSDICLALGIEDTHTVVYALKKLESQKLIERVRQGKEKLLLITKAGEDVCLRYGEVRERLLVEAVSTLGMDPKSISAVASTLRFLSGHYDQAARTATTL
ncbi:Predicted transcription regulator, contains HTH domain, MarR family [Xaviernesmea oryzae]|uniref:Predicted transcription regulator, contains HTH domain, MarR family n=1 Tax=Xaviernesmea oryzae TaxID=464029 RepID=A0A1X7DXH7_9HYPH|nr:winged helix DNA-binding protein [Xaviernesmea oryzae]SMF23204.1 Predicted transcription regulator, contains HTH domain, MarR family [Xaviernesmea oryzae]